MGNCISGKTQTEQMQRSKSMEILTEEEEVRIQLTKITLFIDSYHREVEKLNKNMETCNKRALEHKKKGSKEMAMYFISRRKLLEESAKNYSNKSILLAQRRQKIEDLEQERDFHRILKEANDLLEKHLNQNTINELQRTNSIESEINARDDFIKTQTQQIYSPEIEEEFEELESQELQHKVSQSMAKNLTTKRTLVSMLV